MKKYQSHFFVSALIETTNASTKDSITCSVASSNLCWSCEVLVLSKSGNLRNNIYDFVSQSISILILLNHWWTKWECCCFTSISALPNSFVSPGGLLYFPDPGCQAHMITISLRPQRLERGQVEIVDEVSDCLRQHVIWPDCAGKHLRRSALYVHTTSSTCSL